MRPIVKLKKKYIKTGENGWVFAICLEKVLCVNMKLENLNMVLQMRKVFPFLYAYIIPVPKTMAHGRYDMSVYYTYEDGRKPKKTRKEFYIIKGEN